VEKVDSLKFEAAKILCSQGEINIKKAAEISGLGKHTFLVNFMKDRKAFSMYLATPGVIHRNGGKVLSYDEYVTRWKETRERNKHPEIQQFLYPSRSKIIAEKERAARAAGLSYGYYVALVLERRGRLCGV
jgi:hypothetical protein